jgi:stage II sporulation protein E
VRDGASRERAAHAAEAVTRFSLGFILSGASILGGMSPFAAAFAASSGVGLGGISALLGATAGHLMLCPFLSALKYISMALLAVAAAFVFRPAAISRSEGFVPAAAGISALLVGIISAADGGVSAAETVFAASDAVLCLGCAYFYKTAFSPWSWRLSLENEVPHTISVLILLSTALISLSELRVFGVLSIGRAAAVLAVLLTAYKGGAGMGCAAGLAVGMALDAASGSQPIFAAAYGAAGLTAGVFCGRGRLAFASAFILADAGAAAFAVSAEASPFIIRGAAPAILYEVFAASVVFMLLPTAFISRLSALLPERETREGAARAREYTRRRVAEASQAFRDLFNTTVKSPAKSAADAENPAVIFDRAADEVCRKCERSAICWQENYISTRDALNGITRDMLRRGSVEKSDYPEYFEQACIKIDSFTYAVNCEVRSFLRQRLMNNRLRGNRQAAYSQYSEVAAILDGISTELGGGISVEAELEAKTRKYLKSLGITADVAVFRDRGGRLHAEISGAEINAFRRDRGMLDKLSAVLGVRLCTPEGRPRSGDLLLLEAEPLSASVGVSRMSRREGEVSGDTGAYFKTDEGVLHILLSDGMGSGEAAARLSADCVRILERFLRSGAPPEAAVRMLNGIMQLRSDEDTGCATVDLMCVNLFSGDMTLIKYGAAPTYVKSGTAVKRIRGNSLAAGLSAAPTDAPDSATASLSPGMFAVVVSDGAEDGELIRMISEYGGDDPCELSLNIAEAARARGAEDDVTAIAVRIERRE